MELCACCARRIAEVSCFNLTTRSWELICPDCALHARFVIENGTLWYVYKPAAIHAA